MTPQFTGISVSGVDYSQTEPQKHAFFSDFGSDLRQNGGERGSKYFLKVVMKLKVLQFTFTALARPGKALEDTGKLLLNAPEKMCKKICGPNPFGSWNIHIS